VIGIAHDRNNKDAAIARAAEACGTDVEALVVKRRARLADVALPARLPGELAATYRKAVSVMCVNTCAAEGRIKHLWTTPDRWPHRWMWLHDSAYHAFGHVHTDPDAAKAMLAAVFDTQEADGRIAIQMRPDCNMAELSQAPVLAWAIEHVVRHTGDRDFVAELHPKVVAYLEYFRRTRAFGDSGLFRWLHSDESMDNNPRFDAGADFGAVDLSCMLAREFEAAAWMAELLGRDSEADDWRQRWADVAKAINALLWDDEAGEYGDLLPDGRRRVTGTCVTFLPLYAGIAPGDRASRLVRLLMDERRYWRAMPVPTVAVDDPRFYPDMWRGPSWMNVNHVIACGLDRCAFHQQAAALRQRCVAVIHKWYRHCGCFYEFYDCDDVIPPAAMDRKSRLLAGDNYANVSDYHWTAALFVAFCQSLFG
jgi:putative isomerase